MRILVVAVILFVAGCGSGSDGGDASVLEAAREACIGAVAHRSQACRLECGRFPDPADAADCETACANEEGESGAACVAEIPPAAFDCQGNDCAVQVSMCRAAADAAFAACSSGCESGELRCEIDCFEQRAADEESCGFAAVLVTDGTVEVAEPPSGRPADLEAFLDDDELAVVEAADRRAEELRTRRLRVWVGRPGVEVRIVQTGHAFPFGFPVDFRELDDAPDLETYGEMVRSVANFMVAETSLKWRNSEPQRGELRFDLADAELAWAERNGFPVKAHVLLWGNAPPASSGSGTPEWLRDLFPDTELAPGEIQVLRDLIRERIEIVVGRYAGRIDVWEVTNEMLNPFTSWFASRLGPGIVDDAFRWTRRADPGAELVYNEWISEIFTGLGGPAAADVRDRVVDLLAAGVPVDAVGQQGHFAPGLVNIGVDVDLSERTRIDDYAEALDTLASAGLPVHITEVTFAAPDGPEARAAQAEAAMRVWWGHEAVEEIIFWSVWNKLGPRSHLNLGIYDDGGVLTRHGEAIVSLINDRWRTRRTLTTGDDGAVELRATLGDYAVEWTTETGPVHARFHVGRGAGPLRVIAAGAA